jgi:hypothetical protein
MNYTRHPLLTFALCLAAALAGILAFEALIHLPTAAADTGGPPSLASGSGLAAWWQSGALAAPIAAACFALLVVLERLSCTRWPALAWLRLGRLRAGLSLSVAALIGLLPQIADGSVTWGGLSVALLAGLMALRPGGGERRDADGEGPVPT